MTNRLEVLFSAKLRELRDKLQYGWVYKFQTNKLSHQPGPADFLFLGRNCYLIECKECSGKRLELNRLSQLDGMLSFDSSDCIAPNSPNFISLMVVCFWKGRKNKSKYYVMPTLTFSGVIKDFTKKSINEDEFDEYFSCFEVGHDKVTDIIRSFEGVDL